MARARYPWELPAAIEARLGEDSVGPQRAIYEDNHLLVILHEPTEEGGLARQAAMFLRRPDGEILWNGIKGGDRKLTALLSSYEEIWAQCEKEYEASDSSEALFRLLERLTPLNRSSSNLMAALQSARDSVKQDRFLIGARDRAVNISRAFDLLVADARLALDFRIAKNAEAQAAKSDEMAAAQHKLNLLAAFTFPMMAMATLFGMNLTHGFENLSPLYFWVVLAAGVAIGFFLKGWAMGRPQDKR